MSIPVRVSRGADVGVRQKQPNESYWGRQALVLGGASGDQKRIFIRFSSLAQQIRGRVVLSATLSGRLKTGGNHTVEIAELTEGFNQQTRWNKQPAVRSAGQVSQATTSGDGQRWSIPVTALVQRVASGTTHLGWRLTTPATNDRIYYAFAAENAWRLDIELAEDSDAPVSLEPDGGVVGLANPTLTWAADEGDPDGPVDGSDAQAAYQVRMNTSASTSGLTYDSGTVSSVENQHDMAGFTYSLPSGTPVFWQVRTRDANNVWSDWSDWAVMTYQPYPAVTITSPTSLIYDPSPVVQATVGTTFKNYRWLVYKAGEADDRYDSRRVNQSSGTITHTVPEKFEGVRVLPEVDGASYRIVLRVEDRDDRIATPGDLGYVQVETTVTYGSGAAPAPVLQSVAQIGKSQPKVRLTWTASPTPDSFTVERDNVAIKVALADTTQSGSTFTWDDTEARPGLRSYRVRSVTNDQGGARSAALSTTVGLTATWLVRSKENGGAQVMLDGGPPSLERDDSVAEYDAILGKQTLRVTFQRRFPKGAWTPYLEVADDRDLDADLAVMRQLEKNPNEEVTLIWAEQAITAKLDNLLVTARDDDNEKSWNRRWRRHRISCVVRQTGEA